MSGTSRRGAVRASRLARAAALSGTRGKVCRANRATLLLEAIVEPGDRVTIEGDNQKQAEFPQLEQFSTLSPVPGFRRWLTQQYA